MALYYLVGPPAVGKLTVARELARRTGAIVVDNHLINDPVLVPMGTHRTGGDLAATDELRHGVLEIVHNATERAPTALSHVFTNWLPDEEENARLVNRLRLLAMRRNTCFVPVWLEARAEVLLERVVRPERAERAKLTDPSVLGDLLKRPSLPVPTDALTLDTSDSDPGEVADRIVAFAGTA